MSEAQIRAVVEAAGATYVGLQRGIPDPLVMFNGNVPIERRSTLAIKLSELTEDRVRQAVVVKEREFLEGTRRARMQLPEIIATVIREFKMEPIDINSGSCSNFVEEVLKWGPTLGARPEWGCDLLDLAHLGCHRYIVVGGRCYDAEAPEGVERPHDLPFYQREFSKERKTNEGHKEHTSAS